MVNVHLITPQRRTREADDPSSLVMHFGDDAPLKLDCGVSLTPFQIAYQTYGELNADKSNVVLICHALTLDQHVANVSPVTSKKGGGHHGRPGLRSTPTATS